MGGGTTALGFGSDPMRNVVAVTLNYYGDDVWRYHINFFIKYSSNLQLMATGKTSATSLISLSSHPLADHLYLKQARVSSLTPNEQV